MNSGFQIDIASTSEVVLGLTDEIDLWLSSRKVESRKSASVIEFINVSSWSVDLILI